MCADVKDPLTIISGFYKLLSTWLLVHSESCASWPLKVIGRAFKSPKINHLGKGEGSRMRPKVSIEQIQILGNNGTATLPAKVITGPIDEVLDAFMATGRSPLVIVFAGVHKTDDSADILMLDIVGNVGEIARAKASFDRAQIDEQRKSAYDYGHLFAAMNRGVNISIQAGTYKGNPNARAFDQAMFDTMFGSDRTIRCSDGQTTLLLIGRSGSRTTSLWLDDNMGTYRHIANRFATAQTTDTIVGGRLLITAEYGSKQMFGYKADELRAYLERKPDTMPKSTRMTVPYSIDDMSLDIDGSNTIILTFKAKRSGEYRYAPATIIFGKDGSISIVVNTTDAVVIDDLPRNSGKLIRASAKDSYAILVGTDQDTDAFKFTDTGSFGSRFQRMIAQASA